MRHWSLLLYAFFLVWFISTRPDSCNALNITAGLAQFSSATDLLHEFRRHFHEFNTAVHHVANDDTDVFHLQLLLEDMDEFSNLVNQYPNVFPDQTEWQTLRRPRAVIDPDFLRWAHAHRTTTGIADFLGVSRRTVRRSLLEYGIALPGGVPFESEGSNLGESTDHLNPNPENPGSLHPDIVNAASSIQSSSSSIRRSNMSDDSLDSLVRLLRSHYPQAGIQMLHGMLRSLGHVVSYENIRRSLMRVDPVNRVFDRIRIRRRRYTVPGPNSLWHHDGHHLHNVRIERLWVDVSNYITQSWNSYFTRLETEHQLDVNNPNHIWLLQHLFLPVVNTSLSFWAASWNCHRISQRHGDGPTRSPEDMWGFDMLAQGMRGDSLNQYAMNNEELEMFGVDWEGLRDEDLLSSLRQNYAHEQGHNTWLGQHGPPERLNSVEVEPPSGSMTADEVQLMDEALRSITRSPNEGDVVNLWRSALIYARVTHPHAF
ncbi:hypothetical protein F5880DRAFT_1476277 [Lentinula raphanica]|nr:hypothetical protein F5880DRAFT_1476277 [Lentinula raphanica]